jgi:CheY-like chemotaxis protein
MKLLIVEDEPAQIQLYEDNIESFNKTSDVKIEYDKFLNIEEAKGSLLSPEYDGAIIDLKLSQGTEELEGLEIVEEIEQNQRFPIFIVSGSISSIDDKEENAFFKKRKRDTDFKKILSELVEIYQTGITKILGRTGNIEKYLTSIFWNHLSNSMELWVKDKTRTPDEKQKSLLRYILMHIQEYLEIDENSEFEDYHPAEVYITPPVKNKAFTGDIVINKENKNRFIVLTPSCDLAQGKAKFILLASIENITDGIFNEKVNIIRKGKSKPEVISESELILKKLISNSFSNKYHYLPKYEHIESGLINFQKINTISIKNLKDEFNIIAATNSSFSKDIVARFSYYYSRQGSPDFNVNEIYNSIFAE